MSIDSSQSPTCATDHDSAAIPLPLLPFAVAGDDDVGGGQTTDLLVPPAPVVELVDVGDVDDEVPEVDGLAARKTVEVD